MQGMLTLRPMACDGGIVTSMAEACIFSRGLNESSETNSLADSWSQPGTSTASSAVGLPKIQQLTLGRFMISLKSSHRKVSKSHGDQAGTDLEHDSWGTQSPMPLN